MATVSFRNFILVCRALGLQEENCTNGILFKGMANGKFARIPVHVHAMGRDIADPLFRDYVKRLGFSSVEDFMRYLEGL